MANTTIYNFRFYPRSVREVGPDDFSRIKNILWDTSNSYYESQGELTSYSVPLVFELDPDKQFIELLIEPYKNPDFFLRMDEVAELETYDIWVRSMSDVDFIDRIGIYGESGHEYCTYHCDEMVFYTTDNCPEELDCLGVKAGKNKVIRYPVSVEYHGCICFGMSAESVHYTFDDLIALKDKPDREKGKYGKISACSQWYSDPTIHLFMQGSLEGKFDRVEFRFRNRIVRVYDEANMTECCMLDDWDNCTNSQFLDYLNGRLNASPGY